MAVNSTKQKVVDAASSLFFQNGFHGTSVRDIAEKASVNVSMISYYFKSKQGVFEYVVTTYYEMYLQIIEKRLEEINYLSHLEQLKQLIVTIVQYKQEHFQLTSFIHRELSLDTIFVREMIVTYLAKENHILNELFSAILHEDKKQQRIYFLMQLKGMLMGPYALQHEWNIQMLDEQSQGQFIKQYSKMVGEWLDYINKDG